MKHAWYGLDIERIDGYDSSCNHREKAYQEFFSLVPGEMNADVVC